jgi:hypothetical protein
MTFGFECWWTTMKMKAPWMEARGLDEAIKDVAAQAYDIGYSEGEDDCAGHFESGGPLQ